MIRWDVVAAALAAVAVVAAGVLLFVSTRVLSERIVETLIALVVMSPAVVLGVVVARRRPRNVVGALLSLVGTAPLVDSGVSAWGATAATDTPFPGSAFLAPIAEGSWIIAYAGPLALALVFPTGRLLAPAWRWALGAVAVLPLAFVVVQAFAPADVLEPLTIVLLMALLAVLVASVVAVVARYRRGDDEARRQIRWLAVSAVLAPVALVVCVAGWLIWDTTDHVGPLLALLYVALPVSVAIAMLRHRLYGYDRLLSGTVRWALLVATLGVVVTAVALALGLLLGGGSPIVAAAATLVAAIVFRPLQRGIRRFIDARFQPRRERALRAVRAFVLDVRDGRARPDDLQNVLRNAVGPGITVREDATEPAVITEESARLTPADLRDIEAEARLPQQLMRMQGDLRHALRETEESRSRLVRAADEERRRIQRDLHDGAQSNLVALGIRLRTLRADPAAKGDVADAVELVQRTLIDLRSLAQGVRPSSLDDGLSAAIRAMAVSLPLPVDLDLDESEVSEPLATAVYYVTAEAVTNALKHANATRLAVTLDRRADGLWLIVDDDGTGSADPSGSGIAGVRDRVEAAGGRLVVASPAGVGTRIKAVFP